MDSTGREFNRNRLIALLSAIVLEEVRYAPTILPLPSLGITSIVY